VKTSESTTNVLNAVFRARSEISGVEKDGRNPHFKSKYSTITAVMDAISEPFKSNGLFLMHFIGCDDSGSFLTTRIYHIDSLEWIESRISLPAGKPQEIGSAITYYRRYTITAILGLVQDDDDGNFSSIPKKEKPNEEEKKMTAEQKAKFDTLFSACDKEKQSKVLSHLSSNKMSSENMTYEFCQTVINALEKGAK
jgi:hypothetical protein